MMTSNRNSKHIFLALVTASLSLTPSVSAQQALGTSAYRYDDATQLWRTTLNAAGLSLDSAHNRGYAEFSFEHREGDYHRVQEGGQRNMLQFCTERYQAIGKYLTGYGRFSFHMDRTKNRAWCDVMLPYNDNPFFPGSSIHAKYDTQDFDMTAAVGTSKELLGQLTLGLRLDYETADMSRLRDPRSRTELLDYRLAPSAVYAIDQHHYAGGMLAYRRRKEKIPNITTVQQDPNIVYYQMTGLEQATGTLGGYQAFNREWVAESGAIELDYGYSTPTLHSIVTLGHTRTTEHVYGTYKYQPGRYHVLTTDFATRHRIIGDRVLHELDLTMSHSEGYADEYRQLLVQERDADKGYTHYHYDTQITYRKRYRVKLTQGEFRYRMNFVNRTQGHSPQFHHQQHVSGYWGAHFALQDVHNRHLLPQSELNYEHFDFTLEGGKALWKQQWWIDLSGTAHVAKSAEFLSATPETAYAQEVLLPDMAYYRANYWQGRVALTYQFPLTIKHQRSQWYVKGYADYLHTNNSLSQRLFGVSIGLFN